jgi:multidrug resistance protein
VRGRLGVVFLTVLIDLVGFGIIIPILPYVALRHGAGGLGLGVLMGAFSGMQLLANIVLGRLSDRVGRRPIILATTLINAAGYLVFAVADSYGLLLVARLVSGFASGNISVAQAYVADVTTPAERSKGMGLIGAAFGIGFIVGPALGGLAGFYGGHAAPVLVAAALSLANFALAWRILPESLHPDRRRAATLFDLAHARAALTSPRLRPLMLVWFTAAFAFAGYTTVLPLHAHDVWGWRERELGGLFTAIGVVAAVVQGWAFGRLARRFGDRLLLVAGLFGMAVSIAAVPFLARVPALFAWTIALAVANSLFVPSATGLTSLLAGAAEQGAMLGVAQSLAALGRLLGPELFGGTLDGAGATTAFVGAGAVMVLGALAGLKVRGQGQGPLGTEVAP